MAVLCPIEHLVTVSSTNTLVNTLVLNYEYNDSRIKFVSVCVFLLLFFHFDFKLLGIMPLAECSFRIGDLHRILRLAFDSL